MTFDEWYKMNQDSDYPLDSWRTGQKDCAKQTWEGAKAEALKILDKYRYTPAYVYLRESMEKEL